jgi:stalled ribosome rescue protein Dom34
MAAQHAVVWIDHRVARVIHLAAEEYRLVEIVPENAPRRLHQKRGIIGSGHAPTDNHYLDTVAAELVGVDRVLLTGPGIAKKELADRLRTHHPDVSRHVVAVDTVDHTSERQLVAHARRRFLALDRLDGLPTRPETLGPGPRGAVAPVG